MIAVRLTASMVSNLDSGIDVPEDGSKREPRQGGQKRRGCWFDGSLERKSWLCGKIL